MAGQSSINHAPANPIKRVRVHGSRGVIAAPHGHTRRDRGGRHLEKSRTRRLLRDDAGNISRPEVVNQPPRPRNGARPRRNFISSAGEIPRVYFRKEKPRGQTSPGVNRGRVRALFRASWRELTVGGPAAWIYRIPASIRAANGNALSARVSRIRGISRGRASCVGE